MNNYSRIPLSMDKGRAVLEYEGDKCRVTLQLNGIPTDKLCRPYLLWEDTYQLLPQPLNTDSRGRCALRCEVRTADPRGIRALAVISEDLQPVSIGFVKGEYDWQKCFMLKEEPPQEEEKGSEEPEADKPEADKQEPEDKGSHDQEKEVFKSIVCRLSDDIKELNEYAQLDERELLFKRHERVEPFFGCQGEWIRINIRELAMVGTLWKYMRDPLVVYGCRHFHHLILGRQGDALMFGVPWQYKADYRLEAGIQGFNEIKPLEDKTPSEGDMCYLIRTVE